MTELYDKMIADWIDHQQSGPRMIPSHMHEGIAAYIVHGRTPGGFLSAMIENDLKLACALADDLNKHRIWDFANFFYNHAPGQCWGNRGSVKKWQKMIRKDTTVDS